MRVGLGLLVGVAALMVAVSASAQSEVVGNWRLVAAEDRAATGKVTYPFGEHPSGTLIYDATGHVSVQVMASGRTKWAVFEGAAQTQLGYVAYFGTYAVDAKTHTVTHHIQGHLDPKRIGVDNVRTYELKGDRLTLIEAERPERHVIWERVR